MSQFVLQIGTFFSQFVPMGLQGERDINMQIGTYVVANWDIFADWEIFPNLFLQIGTFLGGVPNLQQNKLGNISQFASSINKLWSCESHLCG